MQKLSTPPIDADSMAAQMDPAETLEKMNARWKHPQAKWGKKWEIPLSKIGVGAFIFLAAMYFLSQLGVFN